MNFLLSLLEEVLDVLFFTWLRRLKRAGEGRKQQALNQDVTEIAHFQFVTVTLWALIGVALLFTLVFVFDVSIGWSMALSIIPIGLYIAYRFVQLLNK